MNEQELRKIIREELLREYDRDADKLVKELRNVAKSILKHQTTPESRKLIANLLIKAADTIKYLQEVASEASGWE